MNDLSEPIPVEEPHPIRGLIAKLESAIDDCDASADEKNRMRHLIERLWRTPDEIRSKNALRPTIPTVPKN